MDQQLPNGVPRGLCRRLGGVLSADRSVFRAGLAGDFRCLDCQNCKRNRAEAATSLGAGADRYCAPLPSGASALALGRGAARPSSDRTLRTPEDTYACTRPPCPRGARPCGRFAPYDHGLSPNPAHPCRRQARPRRPDAPPALGTPYRTSRIGRMAPVCGDIRLRAVPGVV
jgi:hypothetical protein